MKILHCLLYALFIPFGSDAQENDQLIKITNVLNITTMNSISSPYEGSIVYVQSEDAIYYYNGSSWISMTSTTNSTGWSTSGNSANSSQFLGTTTNHDMIFKTNNTQGMVIKNNGRVGINQSNPIGTFHVDGAMTMMNPYQFVVATNGNVGMGINTPTEKLHVNGDVYCTDTVIPDYVFEKYYDGNSRLNPEYVFHSLEETEKFSRKYNHLPGVPSAKEVKKQGGVLINRSAKINLEKIEELHLHLFEMNSKCKDYEKRISHLEEKN